MKNIYLDYAAATPVDPKVQKIVSKVFRDTYGNPSALHRKGKEAHALFESARQTIADVLSAHADEIVMTSGATEANALALLGTVHAARAQGVKVPHVIVSSIEHPSVLRTAEILAHEGIARVDYLSVDEKGIVDARLLRELMGDDTVLVSVMYVNNEVGTVEPLRDIAKEIRHFKTKRNSFFPYFHTDAAQAQNSYSLTVPELGVDLMTLSSGKVYGPRGVGALFVRRGITLKPLFQGGTQERGLRPGTENVALACGFAHALAVAQEKRDKETIRLRALQEYVLHGLQGAVPDCVVNGDPLHMAPHIVNVSIPGVESEVLVLYLDAQGISVSGKSACESTTSEVSHVILALGGKEKDAYGGTLRFSLGRNTTQRDIRVALRALKDALAILRSA